MPGVRAFRDPLAAPKNKGLTNSARGSLAHNLRCKPQVVTLKTVNSTYGIEKLRLLRIGARWVSKNKS